MFRRFLLSVPAKIFFVFNYENREGRVVRTVEKIAFHYVILSTGERGNEFQNCVPFGITVIASVIDAEGKHAAGFEDFEGFSDCGNARFCPGKNIVVSAGEPAEIENDAVRAVGFGVFIDVAVAGADDLAHLGKSVLIKIRFGGINGVLLNIHCEKAAAFSGKFAEIDGIVSVSGSCVYAKITGFDMHFQNLMNYAEGAVFAEHKNLRNVEISFIILIQNGDYVKKISDFIMKKNTQGYKEL